MRYLRVWRKDAVWGNSATHHPRVARKIYILDGGNLALYFQRSFTTRQITPVLLSELSNGHILNPHPLLSFPSLRAASTKTWRKPGIRLCTCTSMLSVCTVLCGSPSPPGSKVKDMHDMFFVSLLLPAAACYNFGFSKMESKN